YLEVARDLARHIVLRLLIDVERAHIVVRDMERAAKGVALEEAACDVVGVRQRPVDSCQDGEGFAFFRGRPGRARPEGLRVSRVRAPARERQGCRRGKELAA